MILFMDKIEFKIKKTGVGYSSIVGSLFEHFFQDLSFPSNIFVRNITEKL